MLLERGDLTNSKLDVDRWDERVLALRVLERLFPQRIIPLLPTFGRERSDSWPSILDDACSFFDDGTFESLASESDSDLVRNLTSPQRENKFPLPARSNLLEYMQLSAPTERTSVQLLRLPATAKKWDKPSSSCSRRRPDVFLRNRFFFSNFKMPELSEQDTCAALKLSAFGWRNFCRLWDTWDNNCAFLGDVLFLAICSRVRCNVLRETRELRLLEGVKKRVRPSISPFGFVSGWLPMTGVQSPSLALSTSFNLSWLDPTNVSVWSGCPLTGEMGEMPPWTALKYHKRGFLSLSKIKQYSFTAYINTNTHINVHTRRHLSGFCTSNVRCIGNSNWKNKPIGNQFERKQRPAFINANNYNYRTLIKQRNIRITEVHFKQNLVYIL